MMSESTQKIGRPRQLYTGHSTREVGNVVDRRNSLDNSLLGCTKSRVYSPTDERVEFLTVLGAQFRPNKK